ncbi:MAG: Mur ligase family protein [Patescibacteria group bacterium]
MLLWLVYALFYLPTILKQNLLWLFLWQSREYRYDKMLDYLSLAESKKVIIDSWTKIRLLTFLVNILVLILQVNYYIQVIAIMLFLLVSALESMIYLDRVLTKKIKLPLPSAKAILVLSLSTISSILLPVFLYFYLTEFDLELTLISLFSLTLWTTLTLFLVPFITGYWLLMIFPFDLYAKNKLFQKAKKYRQTLNKLKVIAISGAFGKTTTKEILDSFLSSKYKVEKILKNQNANVSCARKTLKLKKETEFFICELGAYKLGDGNEICNFIEPDCSIITGLNLQHFSLFGSTKNIISAESESLKFLQPEHIAIINWSSPLCHEIKFPQRINIVKCGIEGQNIDNSEDIQYLAKNLNTTLEGTAFDVRVQTEKLNTILKLHTSLISKGVVQNILHAIAYSLEHNLLTQTEIEREVAKLSSIEGRMQLIQKPWGKLVYNQYNNPDGVSNALELMSTHEYKKIAILDDLLELGDKSQAIHSEISNLLFQSKPDLVALLGRNFSEQVRTELVEKGYPNKQILLLEGKNYSTLKTHIKSKIKTEQNALVQLMGYQSKEFLDL